MKWKCDRCGSCCHSPRLYLKDIARIKRIGLADEDFIYTDELGNKYIKDSRNYCIFLNRKSRKTGCKIYGARPEICRMYPSFVGKDGDCRPRELKFDKR